MDSRSIISLTAVVVAVHFCYCDFPGIILPYPGDLDPDDRSMSRFFDMGTFPRSEIEHWIFHYKRHSFHTEGYLHIDKQLAKFFNHTTGLNYTANFTQIMDYIYDVRMKVNTWPQKDPKTRYKQYEPLHEIMDDVQGANSWFRIIKMLKSMDMFLSLTRTREELGSGANCSDRLVRDIQFQDLYSYGSASNLTLGRPALFPIIGHLIMDIMTPATDNCLRRFGPRILQAYKARVSENWRSKFELGLAFSSCIDYLKTLYKQSRGIDAARDLDMKDVFEKQPRSWLQFTHSYSWRTWRAHPTNRLHAGALREIFDSMLKQVEKKTGKPTPTGELDQFEIMKAHLIEPCKMVYEELKELFELEATVLDFVKVWSYKPKTMVDYGYWGPQASVRALYIGCQFFATVDDDIILNKLWPEEFPIDKKRWDLDPNIGQREKWDWQSV